MKNGRKISMVLMALSAICLFSGWDRDTTKEEKLQYLQFNSTRMDVKKYPPQQLSRFWEDLGSTVSVENEDLKETAEDKNFPSVLLIYEGGETESLRFFKDNDKWFMETQDGTVYENADFITEWIPYEEPENTEEQPRVITSANIDTELFGTYLDALKNQELSPLEGEVAYKVAAFRQQGTPSEKIKDEVRQIFINRWKLFDYAEKEGFFPGEEEQNQMMEDCLTRIKEQPYYEKYNEICEDAGLSFDDIVRKNKDLICELELTHKFYDDRTAEFKEGKDISDGHIYENFREYSIDFMEKNVYGQEPESEEYKARLQELEEALGKIGEA